MGELVSSWEGEGRLGGRWSCNWARPARQHFSVMVEAVCVLGRKKPLS